MDPEMEPKMNQNLTRNGTEIGTASGEQKLGYKNKVLGVAVAAGANLVSKMK